MSAKRNLSAVSAKSGSATFAQTLARIPGIDSGDGGTSQKMKRLCRSLSPSTCTVENLSAGQSMKISCRLSPTARRVLKPAAPIFRIHHRHLGHPQQFHDHNFCRLCFPVPCPHSHLYASMISPDVLTVPDGLAFRAAGCTVLSWRFVITTTQTRRKHDRH